MSAFDLLLTITLDTETLRYSIFGSSTYDYPFEARIKSVGDITRSVSINGGSSPIQSISFDLDDADGELRKKAANTTFKRRVATLQLVDLESGQVATVFTGKLTKTTPYYDTFRVYAYDDTFDKLNQAITLTTSPEIFANIPQETPNELIPIPLGTIDSTDYSAQGHCPAYLVDPAVGQSKFRYVAAQIAVDSIPAVYNGGNLVDGADYTVTWADVSTPIGTVRMTYIDFDADQRDINKSATITYDCNGLTDTGLETGTVITNPAKALKYLLDLRGIVDAADFGDKYTEGETAYDDAGITIRYCATKTGQTWLEMIDEISESLNLQFFVDKDGSYAITFDDAQAPSSTVNLVNLVDSETILKGSFNEDTFDNSPASTMDFGYAYDFARSVYSSDSYYNYSDEQTALGEDIRTRLDMIAAGSIGRAKKMAQIKLFQTSVERQKVTLDCIPMTTLDLTDRVLVTHYSGSSYGGAGFEQKVFRVYGISIRVGNNGVYYTLDLVDNPGVTLGSPSDTEPTHEDVTPPADSTADPIESIAANPVWELTDYNTITWAAFTITISRVSGDSVYSINGSNTDTKIGSAMATDTIYYIYFDSSASSTEIYVSSTEADSVGPSKLLLAVARPASSSSYKPMMRIHYGTVTVGSNIVPGLIGIDEIPDGTIINAHLQDATITGTKIASSTITGSNIAGTTITASNIANSTITGGKIANTTITAANIVNATITGSKIAATTITADLLSTTIAYTGTLTIKDGTTEYCGMTAATTGPTGVRIWSGNTYASRDTAPFRVLQNGTVYATSAIIEGTIRSGSSNPRVEITSAGLKAYDSSGNNLLSVLTSGGNAASLVINSAASNYGSLIFSDGSKNDAGISCQSATSPAVYESLSFYLNGYTSTYDCSLDMSVSDTVTSAGISMNLDVSGSTADHIGLSVGAATGHRINIKTDYSGAGTTGIEIRDTGHYVYIYNNGSTTATFTSTTLTLGSGVYLITDRMEFNDTPGGYTNAVTIYDGTGHTTAYWGLGSNNLYGISLGEYSSYRGAISLKNRSTTTTMPGVIILYDKGGTTHFLWFATDGTLHYSTSDPQGSDTGGTTVATV